MNLCTVDDCARPVKGHGLCNMHYQRMRNTGTTEPPANKVGRKPVIDGDIARVTLTFGQVAIIDAGDADLVGQHVWSAKWNPCTRSYYAWTNIQVTPERRTVLTMSRLILGVVDAVHVDHISLDTLDNRRSNLRLATRSENGRNRPLMRTNTSGYVGVSKGTPNRWMAYTRRNGRRVYIGLYVTAADAAAARDQYIRDNCPSEFWRFNFPRPNERGIHRPQGATA